MEAGSLLRGIDRRQGEGAPTEAQKKESTRSSFTKPPFPISSKPSTEEGWQLPAGSGNAACVPLSAGITEEAIAFLKKHWLSTGKERQSG